MAAVVAVLLPGGQSDAATAQPKPSLAAMVAEARQLSNEIDSLGQQYDGLVIQLSHAKTEERLAKLAAARTAKALAGSQQAVAQLAAVGYMNQGLDPTLQLLTDGDPTQFMNEASTVQELDNQAAERLTTVKLDELASERAKVTAAEEVIAANELQKEINSKVKEAQSKLAVLDSAAMAQAMAVFQKTGNYPVTLPPGDNSVGVIALRWALSVRGDWYVWGAAGPTTFDCSGLVVWAFAHEGITLPHYTGYLWNSGMHVSRADLEPGDLVFFFPDIGHVGMYIGDGLMVDAPTTGQQVQVQPVFWNAYVGAVRIS